MKSLTLIIDVSGLKSATHSSVIKIRIRNVADRMLLWLVVLIRIKEIVMKIKNCFPVESKTESAYPNETYRGLERWAFISITIGIVCISYFMISGSISSTDFVLNGIITIILFLLFIVLFFRCVFARLINIGISGWFALLLFLPVIDFFFIALLLRPSSEILG